MAGFNRPVSSRNLANDVDDATVDSLAGAVTDRMPDIAPDIPRKLAGWAQMKFLGGIGMLLCQEMTKDGLIGLTPGR